MVQRRTKHATFPWRVVGTKDYSSPLHDVLIVWCPGELILKKQNSVNAVRPLCGVFFNTTPGWICVFKYAYVILHHTTQFKKINKNMSASLPLISERVFRL